MKSELSEFAYGGDFVLISETLERFRNGRRLLKSSL